MLFDIISIVTVLLLGYVCCCRFQLRPEFGPVMSVSVITIVNVLAGCISCLWISCIALYVMTGIFFVHQLFINKGIHAEGIRLQEYFLSPGIIGILFSDILYLFVYYFVKKPQYVAWDDFMHWGMFYKNVFYYHNFDIFNSSHTFVHQSYHQGSAALYAFFALFHGEYSERDVFISLNTLIFSSTATMFSSFFPAEKMLSKHHRMYYWIEIITCACGIPFFYYQFSHYTMTYMDIPLGTAFAAALCVIVSKSGLKNKSILLSCILGMIVSLKQTGVVFAGYILLIWLVYLICGSNASDKVNIRGSVRLFCPTVCLPLVIVVVWKSVVAVLGKSDDQFAHMGFSVFLSYLRKARSGEDLYFTDVLKTLIHSVVCTGTIMGHFSILVFSVLLVIISIALCINSQGTERKFARYMCLIMPIMFISYIGLLFYVYICGMSRQEGYTLASFGRYVETYLIGWVQLLIFMIGLNVSKKQYNKIYVCAHFFAVFYVRI